MLQYVYLSRLRLALTRMQISKPDLLFVSILVKSSIDVHQIARKMGTEKFTAGYVVQICLGLAGAGN